MASMAAAARVAGQFLARPRSCHLSSALYSLLSHLHGTASSTPALMGTARGAAWSPSSCFCSTQSHSPGISAVLKAASMLGPVHAGLTPHPWEAGQHRSMHHRRGAPAGGWIKPEGRQRTNCSRGLTTLSPFAEALRTREARLEAEANALADGQADSHHFGRPQDSTPPPMVSPYVTNKATNAGDTAQLITNETHMPVIAYHIGTRLNFYSLAQSPELVMCPRALNRDSIILLLHARNRPTAQLAANPEQYMVVFKYGSVVFINVKDREQRESLLQVCEKFTESPASKPQTEEFNVIVRPSLSGWSELHPDLVVLKRIDTNSVRVISSVLGQSVALDMYAGKVESSLEVFSNLNREMERTGTFTIRKEHLFRLVAQNNILITEIITKLGLLERSDTAWKFAQYGPIWEGLRAEFELDARFQTLDLKINLIQNNVKYFLEILQNRKSDTLEWIIIILIAGEIMLGLYDIFMKV